MVAPEPSKLSVDSSDAYLDRELSWLGFARRVLALVEDSQLPLLERVKFAGIMGMLHDEFFMKRMSGLKRRIRKGSKKQSISGMLPSEQFQACKEELRGQAEILERVIQEEIRPALASEGMPIHDHADLGKKQKKFLRDHFQRSVLPILTPLAVDSEHPFPFISNLGLNLAVMVPVPKSRRERFVRIKVPDNRPRWVPLAGNDGFVPLEQVIAANLDLLFPAEPPRYVHRFRVTRGAEGERHRDPDLQAEDLLEPGSIVRQVSDELKARRFAGVVRLQVDPETPAELLEWLVEQLDIDQDDVYPTETFLGLSDLLELSVSGHEELRFPAHDPVTHPRLLDLDTDDSGAIFDEICRGDILLHHPYHSFDSSVLRFIESAAVDPAVLAIKLTIYRTSSDSPIIQALAEASRRGKQVAVLVEITARFDEAPNIAWGQYLEKEGVHVAYGVEKLKTHVKLALVVREEAGELRRYAHVGTGNYHTRTARIYEDLGILTCRPEVCTDVSAVYNALTGNIPSSGYSKLLVAPVTMRNQFIELIRREAEHSRQGRACGIDAKMNQLQDPEIIRELYRASQAGVPIRLNVRGLSCLRPGVEGLSETVRVFGVVDRFLEHSRIYRFENGGDPEFYIGSADWMTRNLSNRVETVAPVEDEAVKGELAEILDVYHSDNSSVWDCGPDGVYVRRRPAEGEEACAVQATFIERARQKLARTGGRATPPASEPTTIRPFRLR